MGRYKELSIAVAAAAWAVLTPVHTLINWVLVLVATDLAMGLVKAFKTKDPITSRRLRESVGKVGAYMVAILSTFAVDNLAGNTDPTLARIAAVSIALIELKSLDESLKSMGFDLLGSVVAKMQPAPKDKP